MWRKWPLWRQWTAQDGPGRITRADSLRSPGSAAAQVAVVTRVASAGRAEGGRGGPRAGGAGRGRAERAEGGRSGVNVP
jgi:hypothetical protein